MKISGGTLGGRVELAPDQFFDELMNPVAHSALDRFKPVVEKLGGGRSCRLKQIIMVTFVMAWSPFRR